MTDELQIKVACVLKPSHVWGFLESKFLLPYFLFILVTYYYYSYKTNKVTH